MKSFKKIAEELQKQAETPNGISADDDRIISFELVLELSAILSQKGQNEAGIYLFDAWAHLRTLKIKDDEKSN